MMSLVVSNLAAKPQPGKSPDSTTRHPGSTRQPGNPATRQHPAAPAKGVHTSSQPGSTRQH